MRERMLTQRILLNFNTDNKESGISELFWRGGGDHREHQQQQLKLIS